MSRFTPSAAAEQWWDDPRNWVVTARMSLGSSYALNIVQARELARELLEAADEAQAIMMTEAGDD